MKVHYGKVYIPHIDYTVYFLPLKRRAGDPPAMIARAEQWHFAAKVYLPKNVRVGTLTHELTHVLRYIIEEYVMDFRKESEHMAYIMGYLVAKVAGEK